MQTVTKIDAVLGLNRLGRAPIRYDIIVNLVVGGDLDEVDRARIPIAEWLDPNRRPLLVGDAIEIMIEVAVPLQQAETARMIVGEARYHAPRRGVEGPPDAPAFSRAQCPAL